jgi:hypothetical protein
MLTGQNRTIGKRKPVPVPLFYHKSHMDCLGIDPGLSLWDPGDYLCVAWQKKHCVSITSTVDGLSLRVTWSGVKRMEVLITLNCFRAFNYWQKTCNHYVRKFKISERTYVRHAQLLEPTVLGLNISLYFPLQSTRKHHQPVKAQLCYYVFKTKIRSFTLRFV